MAALTTPRSPSPGPKTANLRRTNAEAAIAAMVASQRADACRRVMAGLDPWGRRSDASQRVTAASTTLRSAARTERPRLPVL